MTEQTMEPVELERVRRDAACIIIRVGLGGYELQGAGENMLVPESRVAWATVVHDLQGEGYRMVTPEEYAAETMLPVETVHGMIRRQGTLFAVAWQGEVRVPLPEKAAVLPPIEVPGNPASSGTRIAEGAPEEKRD